jgi:hypothetical protein
MALRRYRSSKHPTPPVRCRTPYARVRARADADRELYSSGLETGRRWALAHATDAQLERIAQIDVAVLRTTAVRHDWFEALAQAISGERGPLPAGMISAVEQLVGSGFVRAAQLSGFIDGAREEAQNRGRWGGRVPFEQTIRAWLDEESGE